MTKKSPNNLLCTPKMDFEIKIDDNYTYTYIIN